MTAIDDYIKGVDPVKRPELQRIRAIALDTLPGAKEAITYGMPTITYKGRSIIGFAAHKSHIGIYPFSGSVISEIKELGSYSQTKGAIQEKLDDLLPEELIKKMISARLNKAFN